LHKYLDWQRRCDELSTNSPDRLHPHGDTIKEIDALLSGNMDDGPFSGRETNKFWGAIQSKNEVKHRTFGYRLKIPPQVIGKASQRLYNAGKIEQATIYLRDIERKIENKGKL
jgi:hypothetical protein